MTATSTLRKSSIKNVAVSVDEGTPLIDAIKDCLVMAVQTDRELVVLTHNGRTYIVNMTAVCHLVEKQSALVTGKHLVPR